MAEIAGQRQEIYVAPETVEREKKLAVTLPDEAILIVAYLEYLDSEGQRRTTDFIESYPNLGALNREIDSFPSPTDANTSRAFQNVLKVGLFNMAKQIAVKDGRGSKFVAVFREVPREQLGQKGKLSDHEKERQRRSVVRDIAFLIFTSDHLRVPKEERGQFKSFVLVLREDRDARHTYDSRIAAWPRT